MRSLARVGVFGGGLVVRDAVCLLRSEKGGRLGGGWSQAGLEDGDGGALSKGVEDGCVEEEGNWVGGWWDGVGGGHAGL